MPIRRRIRRRTLGHSLDRKLDRSLGRIHLHSLGLNHLRSTDASKSAGKSALPPASYDNNQSTEFAVILLTAINVGSRTKFV